MSHERVVEEQDTGSVDEEAERFIELERDIRDARDAARDDSVDRRLDLTVGGFRSALRAGVRTADVVSASRVESGLTRHDRVELRIAVDGEIRERRIPYPDDPTDHREPLVRLCQWDGTDPDRLADLDTVPVVAEGEETAVYVPPGREMRRAEIVLPGGITRTVEYEALLSRWRRWWEWGERRMASSPFVSGDLRETSSGPVRALSAACIAALSVIAAAALFSPILSPLALVAGMGSFFAIASQDIDDPFDTYR